MEPNENKKKFLDWAGAELMCGCRLEVRDGAVLWDECVESAMDEVETLQDKGLELETVEAEETNMGFGFMARSADGTPWESGPLDCHEYESGQKVGRFIDGNGKLVIVRKK
jgi:hypothetical protein